MVFGWKKGSEEMVNKKEELAVTNAPTQKTSQVAAPQSSMTSNPSADNKDDSYSGSSDDSIQQKHGKVRSALGPGTVIQGKLSFDTPVRIDGKLSGEIFSSKTLIIGKTGQIDARVEVASLIVYGSVTGIIKATEKVEIYEGATVEGQVETPSLMVESGSRLHGDCSMGGKSKSSPSVSNDVKAKSPDKPNTDIVTNDSIDLDSVINASKSKDAKTSTSKEDQPSAV